MKYVPSAAVLSVLRGETLSRICEQQACLIRQSPRCLSTTRASRYSRLSTPTQRQLRFKSTRTPSAAPKKNKTQKDLRNEEWELTVGIEIHAELNTAAKLFSPAQASLAASPNTHVAVFDAAQPGAQPVFQRETLLSALRAAIALDCEIQRSSSWDRKHYFWWDQPNGYQITQYYRKS